MIHNGFGMFSYSTTITRPGRITLNVIRSIIGVKAEYYNGRPNPGTPVKTIYHNNINFAYGTGDIFPG